MKHIVLSGSKRRQPSGARRLPGTPSASEQIEVTVVLRPATDTHTRLRAVAELGASRVIGRAHLQTGAFQNAHGARKSDIDLLTSFAKTHRLEVVDWSRKRRCVILKGTIMNFNRAFRIESRHYRHAGNIYRSHAAPVQIPATLADSVVAVLGLDDRPLMQHHAFASIRHAVRHVNPKEVMNAYHFPSGVSGKKQTIAIIELGGGFHESDITKYFRGLRIKRPKIDVVEIDGQKNNPATPEAIQDLMNRLGLPTSKPTAREEATTSELKQAMWTVETTLDIQIAGAFANGADIIVYFAPNSAQGKYHAFSSALHRKNGPPAVITCSWGAQENDIPEDVLHSLDQLFQDAALLGVTVCFSSGDSGEDADANGLPRVHFPASSPHVLACGGTHWQKFPRGRKITEVVWNEPLPKAVVRTGGGVSKYFALPEWQTIAKVEAKTGSIGRGVPDVAGKADMATGYRMLVGGIYVTMGGTSSVAPMWAALIARCNQKLGTSAGYITPLIYNDPDRAGCTDILKGNSGPKFHAEPGWDACTGWGTPNGKNLLNALKSTAAKAD